MTTLVELTWADGGAPLAWVAGLPLRLPLRLTSTSAGARPMVRLEEPSKHLAFGLTPDGGATRWLTGRDWMTLAGDPTHEGVAIVDTLPAGGEWSATHALDAYAEPPPAGRYTVRARYLTPDGDVAETSDRAVEVVAAGFMATGSAVVASSGRYLAHALATGDAAWLRVASSASPQGATFAFPVCRWPGGGTVAVAQHAFSPRTDPPLEAFRYWAVWHADGRLGGARATHQGAVEASFEAPHGLLAGARMLEPVQFEDGSLRVPMLESTGVAARVVWVHVSPDGQLSYAGTQDLPPDAELVRVSAFANGVVVVLWVDHTRRVLQGLPARTAPTAEAPRELARFDAGEVLWFDAIDGRRGVTALVVQGEALPRAQRLAVWRAAPTGLDALGEAVWDRGFATAVRATEVHPGGAALALRDDRGALHLTRLDGVWEATGVACGLDLGVTAGPYAIIGWGVDAAHGLRFTTGRP